MRIKTENIANVKVDYFISFAPTFSVFNKEGESERGSSLTFYRSFLIKSSYDSLLTIRDDSPFSTITTAGLGILL